MPEATFQDTQEDEIEVVERPSQTALRRIASDIDFNKVLKWEKAECMGEWYALLQKPPLHSVVAHIGPDMAAQLLRVSNTRNRRLMRKHANNIGEDIKAESYELTGDTIKFSKAGLCLDGQHRLQACQITKEPILTHVVFGLNDEVFDVIDQGKKRSAADVLHLLGIDYSTLVAGAVRWVFQLRDGHNIKHQHLTPRVIKQHATGDMKDLSEWTRDARLINEAFKHPPTLIAALLFLIGKNNRENARNFAHEWIHGARVGRNKNFDVLQGRLQQVRQQSGGALNPHVRAAMIVQTFNHWHAHLVAAPRALTWRREWMFPRLEFNAEVFARTRGQQEILDTSLKASQVRILSALIDRAEGQEARITQADLAQKANVPIRQLPDVLRTLIESKNIAVVKVGAGPQPSTYRIISVGK